MPYWGLYGIHASVIGSRVTRECIRIAARYRCEKRGKEFTNYA
jgi:hypothetical protein